MGVSIRNKGLSVRAIKCHSRTNGREENGRGKKLVYLVHSEGETGSKERRRTRTRTNERQRAKKWEGTSEHEIEQGKQAFLTHSSVYRSLSFALALALSILTLDGVVSIHPVRAASFLTIPDFAFWARQSIFFSKEKKTENPLGETPPM